MGKRQESQAKFVQQQVDRLLVEREKLTASGADTKRIDTELAVLKSRIHKLIG